MAKGIELTKGRIALVDDEDYERVSSYKWSLQNTNYAASCIDGKKTLLHRFILDVSQEQTIDHKNRDGLDCRRENLRLCTHSQNQHNRPAQRNNSTGYKGVRWNKTNKRYAANISVDGHRIHLGYFDSPEDAAYAYDQAALQHYGEFAWTNIGGSHGET